MPANNPSPTLFAASRRERLVAALASALILAGLCAVLVFGLRPPAFIARGSTLVTIVATPERPRKATKPAAPSRRRDDPAAPAPQQAAGASAARAVATAIAPSRPMIILLPPTTVAASQPSAGDAPVTGQVAAGAGPGTAGTGTGPGGGGTGGSGSGGSGDGAGQGIAVHARQTRGQLSPRDVPDGLIAPGGQVSVAVRFTITPEGRASACRVIRSSGSPRIDAVPCPLLETRYRFRPARDRSGKPTAETLEETHTWFEPGPR